MNNMNRGRFLKNSMKAGALVILAQAGSSLAAEAGAGIPANWQKDNELMKKLVDANDKKVEALLNSDRPSFGRGLGQDFACLAAAYASPESKYYHSEKLVPEFEVLVASMLAAQSADGTLNAGNLESPPDTGFVMESLAAGAYIIEKDKSPALDKVRVDLKRFVTKTADALAVGGVHTPNHRGVVCAALARMNEVYPSKKSLDRIADWMGEGIFCDKDGHYPERSQNYGNVENNSMLTLARLLDKPQLLVYPRRNLEMVYYYMEPNGDLVVNDSRRQDQWSEKSILSFYMHYRYLAIRDNNGLFAAIARFIEKMDGFEKSVIGNSLYEFLENPLLQEQLPPSGEMPVEFAKLFTTSSLLRIRHGEQSTTLFGGCDLPTIIASGRSNSPNFYAYRKGKAILKYMRMSSSFFSMGYFHSDGLKKEGNTYTLHRKLTAPYYQPLPKNKRNSEGDYKLSQSIDGRFWNKMDFENRPVSNVKSLDSTVQLTDNNGANELEFIVDGPAGVPVTIELCFEEGGKLSGVTKGDNENSFLERGEGSYEFGGDKISFGPGTGKVGNVRGLEGELYSTHFGSLRTKGMYVYLSGVTPFRHKLKFS